MGTIIAAGEWPTIDLGDALNSVLTRKARYSPRPSQVNPWIQGMKSPVYDGMTEVISHKAVRSFYIPRIALRSREVAVPCNDAEHLMLIINSPNAAPARRVRPVIWSHVDNMLGKCWRHAR